MGDEMRDKRNGDTRRETEKNGRQDARQKKWEEEMLEKNGETRRETKKMEIQDVR